MENLPRIRDVLDHEFARHLATMAAPEEAWVEGVAEAYRGQELPQLTHFQSFMARAHDAFLAWWWLAGGDDAKGVAPFLTSLARASGTLDRTSLAKLATALASADSRTTPEPKIAPWVRAGRSLPPSAQLRVRKAGRDLGQLLGDLPDSSLAADWASLCAEMASGVGRPPKDALEALGKTLGAIRHVGNARVWVVGSSASQAAIAEDIDRTLASLDASPAPPAFKSTRRRVFERARARGVKDDLPFVALVNPNMGSGSLVHLAPSIGFDEARPEALVDYLAVNVFDGEGTQSFYKRIGDKRSPTAAS